MVNVWSGPTAHGQDRNSDDDPIVAAVGAFGRAVAGKLDRGGGPEDQLRGPVEELLRRLGTQLGVETVAYGEVSLKEVRARPDYAVDVGQVRVGYLELKAPGRGVPPQWRPDKREQIQWEKLAALPNLIYTDGQDWARYKYGEPAGDIVTLGGSIRNPDKPLHPVEHSFEMLIKEFLLWKPERPRTLPELIRIIAGLCRLLRDEVMTILAIIHDHPAREDLQLLAEDWRDLLFPNLDDVAFSDAYAQTVTFAMLLARANGIVFDDTPLHEIARQLGKKHSLIGKSFAVLTDSDSADEIRAIETLRRVIGAADWAELDNDEDLSRLYVELYESFLAEYDPALRKKSGSYYTPEPVARFMVEFVDQVLRSRLRRSWGFASDDVVVVDPAMGTGTFLVEIVRAVAETVDERQGKGARPARLRELVKERLVGFECQVAPYAVAELRLQNALRIGYETEVPATEVRFLADALEDPGAQQGRFRAAYKIIERSKAEANRIKREVPLMVVIGNPPHLENAKKMAPWLVKRRRPGFPMSVRERPSMDEFRVAGLGRYESDLHGLQWYFWRWAMWKVFDAHPDHPAGVVAFITPSSYLAAKAFAGMREYIRRTCDEGWIIDVSPEGNRSDVDTRIFSGVQRQLCIGVFARFGALNASTPARIHFKTVAGTRKEKVDQLERVRLDDSAWTDCETAWHAPFLPARSDDWLEYPPLADLMPWTSRGVTVGRTWAYAPDPELLEKRWRRFLHAGTEERKKLFKEARDRKLNTKIGPLPGFADAGRSLAHEHGPMYQPIRVAYRSFDRQWLIPDNRLMAVPRPPLWSVRSDSQIYVTEQSAHPIESGPGLTFTGLIPDIHHYNVRSGRVLPLYRDARSSVVNFAPQLISYLSRTLGVSVCGEDVLSYIAGVVAHAGYTRLYCEELKRPGIRVPLTSELGTWKEAMEVGREIIWLHTYGERCVDEQAGRPYGVLELTERFGPKVRRPIPDTPDRMPDEIGYDAETLEIRVGDGAVGPVSPEVWEYDVGGMHVLGKWLDYRRKKPRYKKVTSDLDKLNCFRWSRQLTDELLALVAVLSRCIDLEPKQAAVLSEILKGPLITVSDFMVAGLMPVPVEASRAPKVDDSDASPLF